MRSIPSFLCAALHAFLSEIVFVSGECAGDEDGFVAYVGVYLQPVMLAVFTARARAAMPADAPWSIEGALHDDLSLSLALDFLDIAVMYNEALCRSCPPTHAAVELAGDAMRAVACLPCVTAKYTTLRREAPGSGDFWVYLGVLAGVLVSTLSLGLAFPSHDSRNSPAGPHGGAQGDVFLSAKFEFVVGLLLLDIPLLLLRFYWLVHTGKVPWFVLKNLFCIFLRPLKLNQCRLAERERAKGSQRSIYSLQLQPAQPLSQGAAAAGTDGLAGGSGAETLATPSTAFLPATRRRLSASALVVQETPFHSAAEEPAAVPTQSGGGALSAQNAVAAAMGSNLRAVRRGVLQNLQKIRPRASMLGLQPLPRREIATAPSKASSEEGLRSSLFSFGSSRQESLLFGEGGTLAPLVPAAEGGSGVVGETTALSEEENEEDAQLLPLAERRRAAALRCRRQGLRAALFGGDLLFSRSVPPHRGALFLRSCARLQRCLLGGGRRGLSSVLDGAVCGTYSETLRLAAASVLLDCLHLGMVLVAFSFPMLAAFGELSPVAAGPAETASSSFVEFFPATPWTQLSNTDKAAVVLWGLSVAVAFFGCLCTAPLVSVLLAAGAHAVSFFSRCLMLRVFAARLVDPALLSSFVGTNSTEFALPEGGLVHSERDAQFLQLTLTGAMSLVFMAKPLMDLCRDSACFLWALVGRQYFSCRSKAALEGAWALSVCTPQRPRLPSARVFGERCSLFLRA